MSVSNFLKIGVAALILALICAHLLGVPVEVEGGPLEIAHVSVLALATLVLIIAIIADLPGLGLQARRKKLAYAFGLLGLPFTGVFRELDFGDEIGLSSSTADLIETFTLTSLCLFLLIAIILWVSLGETRWRAIPTYLKCTSSRYIYLGLALFAVSSVFEQGAFGVPYFVFGEELFELLSFLTILHAAWYVRWDWSDVI